MTTMPPTRIELLSRAPARSLERLTREAAAIDGVKRGELSVGDRVIVATRNSIYSITACADESYLVAGGWFDLNHSSPARVRVNGCTLGGSCLLTQLIAAPGLFIEFGNSVRTTRVRHVRMIRAAQ